MIRENIQLSDVINSFIENSMLEVHTSLPAIVSGISEDKKTIKCTPVISKLVGSQAINMPEFIEVPPLFMQGGGSYTAHPVAVGDYCLLIISERCFDNWYEGRDNVLPPEFRKFDYSDAFAIVGINPKSTSIEIPDRITQMGDSYSEGNHEQKGNIEIDGNTNQAGSYSSDANIEAATYSVGGESGASGTFTSQDGKSVTVVNGLITLIV